MELRVVHISCTKYLSDEETTKLCELINNALCDIKAKTVEAIEQITIAPQEVMRGKEAIAKKEGLIERIAKLEEIIESCTVPSKGGHSGI